MRPPVTSLSTDEASMIKCLLRGTSVGYGPAMQHNAMDNIVKSDTLPLDYSPSLSVLFQVFLVEMTDIEMVKVILNDKHSGFYLFSSVCQELIQERFLP